MGLGKLKKKIAEAVQNGESRRKLRGLKQGLKQARKDRWQPKFDGHHRGF
jgi:hypothetical protein